MDSNLGLLVSEVTAMSGSFFAERNVDQDWPSNFSNFKQ